MPLISTASSQTYLQGREAKYKRRLVSAKQFTGMIMTEIVAIHIVLTLQSVYCNRTIQIIRAQVKKQSLK
jgi:hypothetical protein